MKAALTAAWLASCGAAAAGAQGLSLAGSFPVPAGVRFTAVSSDGRQVAAVCGDRRVRVFEFPGGRVLSTILLDWSATALGYSRDGKRLALGGYEGAALVVDPRDGATLFEAPALPGRVDAVALSPDGRRLATAAVNQPAQLWDVDAQRLLARLGVPFGSPNALSFAPNGKLLVAAQADTTIRAYEAKSGAARWTYEGLELQAFGLDFSADSRTLVVGGADRQLVALEARTGRERGRQARQPDPIGGLAVLGDGATVAAVCFAADDMNLSRALLTWDSRGGETRTVETGRVFGGGGALADGSLRLTSYELGELKVWSLR